MYNNLHDSIVKENYNTGYYKTERVELRFYLYFLEKFKAVN